jgi:hypothetical protein
MFYEFSILLQEQTATEYLFQFIHQQMGSDGGPNHDKR